MTRRSNSIDIHVGRRIRVRRIEKRLSQTELGNSVGVTFQQVQKYEKGVNRVGAGRLRQISDTLEVPISWFFEDAPARARPAEEVEGPLDDLQSFLVSRRGVALARAIVAIPNRRAQARLVDALTRLANAAAHNGAHR